MITKWYYQKYNAHTLLSRTGRANKGMERDAPDVAPLHKVGFIPHWCKGCWVCAILDERGCGIIGMASPKGRHR
jgi:hypothetical protein